MVHTISKYFWLSNQDEWAWWPYTFQEFSSQQLCAFLVLFPVSDSCLDHSPLQLESLTILDNLYKLPSSHSPVALLQQLVCLLWMKLCSHDWWMPFGNMTLYEQSTDSEDSATRVIRGWGGQMRPKITFFLMNWPCVFTLTTSCFSQRDWA